MIYLGADHRGFELKEKIKTWLSEWGYEVEDCGAFEYNENDDYVDFVSKVAKKVSEDSENNKGIVLGMTGQGEAMVANKFKGIRAAVFYGPPFQFKKYWDYYLALRIVSTGFMNSLSNRISKEVIKLSKEHNDANVLSLGAYFLSTIAHEKSLKDIIKLWLETKFSGEERHVRRINKIKEIENANQ